MEWTKATIKTTTFGAEIVTGVLIAAGIPSAEIIDPQDRIRHLQGIARTWDYAEESLLRSESDDAFVVFYVTMDRAGELLIENVKDRLKSIDSEFEDVGCLSLSLESADEENWAHEWKKHFKPLKIGKVVVVPEWEDYSPDEGEVILKIDPGSAFGTGQHQTTQLCMLALQAWLHPGDKLLDIGCGSGILSVLGLLLDAEAVYACDIDPAGAISATRRNGALNPIDMSRMTIKSGDILSDENLRQKICKTEYDVVVANIVADVVIDIASIVSEFMKADGLFIASGIISERLDDVLIAFSNGGLDMIWQNALEGWHCIVGKHIGEKS